MDSLWTEHFNVGWLLSAAQRITTTLNGMLSFSLVVLVYIIIGLLEVEPVTRRLKRMTNQEAALVLLQGFARIGAKYRRYMLVRTLMSAVTGLLVWGFIWLCGLPLAREWGILAFAFHYIPVIGPLLATVLPTLFAVLQFDTLQSAVLVFGILNLIQFMVGSYLEPRVAGNILAISPFVVLFAVFFWTWLWGLGGAFIGVPIVIALLTLCEQHPATRWGWGWRRCCGRQHAGLAMSPGWRRPIRWFRCCWPIVLRSSPPIARWLRWCGASAMRSWPSRAIWRASRQRRPATAPGAWRTCPTSTPSESATGSVSKVAVPDLVEMSVCA